jgi:SAM-dependent methyltransferase
VAKACGPTAVYEAGLRSVDGGLWVCHADGRREALPVNDWRGGLLPGDALLLARCVGPTLDVGCGPGRLSAALAAGGVPALGIDVAPFAVRLARRSGAAALCRDVFGPLPGEGRWSAVLLADGNIGIGGDSARLLTRLAALLGPAGRVLLELAAPGARTGPSLVRLEGPDGHRSRPFPWALVGAGEIGDLAWSCDLRVVDEWSSANRRFAALTRR